MTLAEIAELLARHGGMRASLTAEHKHGDLDISIEILIPYRANQESAVAELAEDLQRLIDLMQIGLFAERYGVPPEKLVEYLTKED